MKRILSTQSGMSIVQVLIAASMMGGLALVMGKMGENQSKMQRGARESFDINSLHNSIEKILLNSVSCRETITQISSLPIKPLTSNSGVSIDHIVSKIDDEPGTQKVIKYKIGKENRIGTVYIESIKATRFNQNEIRLRFVIKKIVQGKHKGFGAQSLNKDIVLFGKFTGNNPTGCYSQMDNAVISAVLEACKSLNGQIINHKCVNTFQCDFEKQTVDVTGGSTKSCNPPYSVPQLHGGMHSGKQCETIGGTTRAVNIAGKSTYLCELPAAGSCPSGWNQAGGWGQTSSKSACGASHQGKSCNPRCVTINGKAYGLNSLQTKRYGDDRRRVSLNGCTDNWHDLTNAWVTKSCF